MSKSAKKCACSLFLLTFIITLFVPSIYAATTFKEAFKAKTLRNEAMSVVGIDTFNDDTYATVITDEYKDMLSKADTLDICALAGIGSGKSNGRPMYSEVSFNSSSKKVYFYSDVGRILYQNGIEYFTGIKNLNLSGHALSGKLDLTNNPDLEVVKCSYNIYKSKNTAITSVDLSKATKLRYFDCSYNYITELDLSNSPNLETLDCSFNRLKELDLSGNKNLKSVDCTGNSDLKTLKVKNGVTVKGYSGEVTYAGSVFSDNIGLISAISSISVVILAIITLAIINKRRTLALDEVQDEDDNQ